MKRFGKWLAVLMVAVMLPVGALAMSAAELVAALDGGVEMTQEERLERTRLLIEFASTLGEAQSSGLPEALGTILPEMQSVALAVSMTNTLEQRWEPSRDRFIHFMTGLYVAMQNGISISEYIYHYLGGHGVGSTARAGAGQSGSVERWIVWGEEGEGLMIYLTYGDGLAMVEAVHEMLGEHRTIQEAHEEIIEALFDDDSGDGSYYDGLRQMVNDEGKLSADEVDKVLQKIVDGFAAPK